MNPFKDIEIGWRDETFIIPSNKVLGAIASVEEVVTVQQLAALTQVEDVPLSKLAQAYGALLRYAGCSITDEEVYQGAFEHGGGEDIGLALIALFEMLTPARPAARAKKKAAARASRKTENSSRRIGKH